MRPHGKYAVDALPPVGEQGSDHVDGALALQDGQQRMLGSVRIPEREDRVIGETVCLVDVPIESAVPSVDVGVDHRAQAGMVERGIEVDENFGVRDHLHS